MGSKPKKSPKIGDLCLKLVKFVVFTQKIPKKISFRRSEKFHLELARDNLVKMFVPILKAGRIERYFVLT